MCDVHGGRTGYRVTISSIRHRTRCASLAAGLALGLSLVTPPGGGVHAAEGVWSELAPPCRAAHSAVYDPVRDRVLVFGGSDGLLRNDLWSLSLSGTPQWTHLHPTGAAPSPRQEHSAIYDPIGDRMLVFGGNDGAPCGDLWQLTLSGTPHWTLLSPGGSPPAARSGHSAIYDPVRQRMIVFAGQGAGATVLDDAWALSLGGSPAWTLIVPQSKPPEARARAVAIYDPPRDRLVMFGGDRGQPNDVLSDAWALSLGASPAWTLITPSGAGPDARSRAMAIYDPNGDQLILEGGSRAASFTTYDDLWRLSLATGQWTLLGHQQPLLHAAGAVYDPVRARLLLVGGSYHSTVFLSHALVLPLASAGGWSFLVPSGPGSIAHHSAVFDPVRGRLVTFGGLTKGLLDPSPRDDTWSFDPEAGAWEYVAATGPAMRHGHTAVFDAPRDRMLVFGGDDLYGFPAVHNDTWSLDFGSVPAWTQLTPSGSPPAARYDHSAIVDPVGDRMIVFGGSTGGLLEPPGRVNDVWALGLSEPAAWTPITPAGTAPAPRQGHTAVLDPNGQRMVVFGGRSDAGLLNDVWVLTLTGAPAWIALTPAGSPPSPRYDHVAVYDPVGDRMLVYGGYTSLGTVDEVWALSLGGSPAWSRLVPYGGPPGRPFEHAADYDPAHQRMLVCMGYGQSGVWALQPPGSASAGPHPLRGLALIGARPNPAVGDLIVAFTLPDAGPARIELFDAAGRRAASRDVGALGAGTHRVTLAPAGRLPAGIYLVRLTHASRSIAIRAAVMR